MFIQIYVDRKYSMPQNQPGEHEYLVSPSIMFLGKPTSNDLGISCARYPITSGCSMNFKPSTNQEWALQLSLLSDIFGIFSCQGFHNDCLLSCIVFGLLGSGSYEFIGQDRFLHKYKNLPA